MTLIFGSDSKVAPNTHVCLGKSGAQKFFNDKMWPAHCMKQLFNSRDWQLSQFNIHLVWNKKWWSSLVFSMLAIDFQIEVPDAKKLNEFAVMIFIAFGRKKNSWPLSKTSILDPSTFTDSGPARRWPGGQFTCTSVTFGSFQPFSKGIQPCSQSAHVSKYREC